MFCSTRWNVDVLFLGGIFFFFKGQNPFWRRTWKQSTIYTGQVGPHFLVDEAWDLLPTHVCVCACVCLALVLYFCFRCYVPARSHSRGEDRPGQVETFTISMWNPLSPSHTGLALFLTIILLSDAYTHTCVESLQQSTMVLMNRNNL